MNLFLQLSMSLGIALVGYHMVVRLEMKGGYYPKTRRKKIAAIIAVIYLVVAAWHDGMVITDGINLKAFLWASLALAAYCDYCTTEIYDVVYLPAVVAGVLMLTTTPGIDWLELLIFLGIQWTLFYRLFGTSDCIAYSICAFWLALDGGTLFDFSMLMMLSWVSLAVVQLFRRNINRKGNLKEEVAWIPYIAASMLTLTIVMR